jgi:hypothetical protein
VKSTIQTMQRSATLIGRHTAHKWNSAAPRAGGLHRHLIRPVLRSAVEVAAPAAVDSTPQNELPPVQAQAPAENVKTTFSNRSNRQKKQKGSAEGNASESTSQSRSSPEASDRSQTQKRCNQLLKGEAVALSMASTPEGVGACFKGLRPVTRTMKAQGQTLLFFPSTRLGMQQQPKGRAGATKDAPEQEPPPQQSANPDAAKDERRQARAPMLDLALVAVPYFQKPEPEVNLRVGAK